VLKIVHQGLKELKEVQVLLVQHKVLKEFRESTSCTVLLISLKAGGVALNLTAASRVFLMDLWWNPAAEMQAMDRSHRLGQHRSITVTRFVVKDTVEERILALQEKKRLVFDATVGQGA
jgi:DNA repair protein RAD16